MRKLIPSILFFLVLSHAALAQNHFEISPDKNGGHIFKGIISREALEADTSFKWYAENKKGYTPNSVALAALKQYGDSIQLLSFMGTWCEDSHVIIPKYYSLLDAAGFAKDRQTIIAVDRNKKTLSHLAEALGIINVPTIIVLKNGKELGRVVEYGKYGMWDKELGEIIQNAWKQ
jgi:thiol-disulfide isomerase/thioredoxin